MSTNVIAARPLAGVHGPANPAEAMLTAPILPTLVRLSRPNMMAMLAMVLVTIAETAYVGTLGTPSLAGWHDFGLHWYDCASTKQLKTPISYNFRLGCQP